MRWKIPALFLLLLAAAPARGGEPSDEELRLIRTAMEARLKAGDLLKEKGDLEGALEAYEEAMALYREYKAKKKAAPGGFGGQRRADLHRTATGRVKDAVERALAWLAAHQFVNDDGRWDCSDFMELDPPQDRCGGPGGALFDVGVTGLSLLAFLGAGYTDRGTPEENPYAKSVRQGLRFLLTSQDQQGLFGARRSQHFMYNHAIAAFAMCEAFGLTGNPRYRAPAQQGLDFLAAARNPYLAWRYEPRGGENDTSVTGWCVMALHAGRSAGLAVDHDAFNGARLWIEKMTDAEFGNTGYNFPGGSPARPEGQQDRFPPEKSQSMTASAILTRILTGEDPRESAVIRKGADLCLQLPPVWNPDDGSIDMYYWFHGTQALFQVGGARWRQWNVHMKDALLENQHPEGAGSRAGSWDPAGVWGNDGGRVYSTAILTLCLETYYRSRRLFGPQ